LNTLRENQRMREEAEHAKANLSRYFSPNLVAELAENPGFMSVGGERRELSFVFTDLADFTPLVESLEPEVVVPLLNEYLDRLTQIVFQHGGTVDKVVGDAVHAMFGAPLAQVDHAKRAVDCAMAIDACAEAFREEKDATGVRLGITRIGVHSGLAIVGNFGGEMFFDYTAHGDAVNTTARLEAANKILGTRICVSADTAKRVPDFLGRPIGVLLLKGRSGGLRVQQPLTIEQARSPACAAYRTAFDLLESCDSRVGQALAAAVGTYGEDPLATFHLKRALTGESGVTIRLDGC